MKQNGIFVDCGNPEHVKWWNEVGSKLVKVERYDTIVEVATGKTVGVLFKLKGLLADYVIKKNNEFISNGVTAVLKRD